MFSGARLITHLRVAQKLNFFFYSAFSNPPFSSIQSSTDCQGVRCYLSPVPSLMEGKAQPMLTGRVSPLAFNFRPPRTRATKSAGGERKQAPSTNTVSALCYGKAGVPGQASGQARMQICSCTFSCLTAMCGVSRFPGQGEPSGGLSWSWLQQSKYCASAYPCFAPQKYEDEI